MRLLVTKLRKTDYGTESVNDCFFYKSVNILQSYKQDRDCLVQFLRLLAVCWPGAQSARDSNALACVVAEYSPTLSLSLLKEYSFRDLSQLVTQRLYL